MKSRAFRRILRTVGTTLAILAIAAIALVVTGNGHILNGITKTYLIGKSKPDIDDMHLFDIREIASGEHIPWNKSVHYNAARLDDAAVDAINAYETTAFLVLYNDSLFFEEYWLDGGPDVMSNTFSMAKTFTSLAVGAAWDEGTIDIDTNVGAYLPEYATLQNADLKVRHLLEMSSGIDFGESYSDPFGYQARAYYGDDLWSLTVPYEVSVEPGTEWKYEGGNSVILGKLVKEATGQWLSEYFSEKVWKKLGAERNAAWNLDHEGGLEKAFSAVYATAPDYARLGQMMLDSGWFAGNQIISQEYFRQMITPVYVSGVGGELTTHYGLHYWLGEYDGHPFYSFRGMRGQYVMTLPWKNAVVVRLGHQKDEVRKNNRSIDMDFYIETALELIAQYE